MTKLSLILAFPFLIVLYLIPSFGVQAQNGNQVEECMVSLKNGTVIGALTGTHNPDKKVCAYTAIPFASPPVNDLRFQAPQPNNVHWGTLNATSIPNWCPQELATPPGVQISEDCLYLNVYQPRQQSKKEIGDNEEGLPVMIWLHGGQFVTGNSLWYGPTKLLARGDVILVVPHYRLGLLGFLSTGDATVPGNNGLKDQAFAIRWVHENIAAFGGNPNNVKIFGESAGGASVIFQLISPLNKGLIHGAIAQSGTALASWAVDRNPAESAKLMAKRLDCPTTPNYMMVACLQKVPWEKIIKAQTADQLENYVNFKFPAATVAPVIESKDVPGAFISEEPATIMKSGDIPDIPVMIGANKHDGSFVLATIYAARIGPQNLDKNATYMKHEIVPEMLNFINMPDSDPGNRAVASSVELTYLSGVNRSSWEESMPGLVDIMTVFAFKSSTQNTAELLSSRNRRVYLSSFEHHSNNSIWTSLFTHFKQVPVYFGVAHADDMIYPFDFPGNFKFSPEDQTVSDTMVDMWLNFAKFGNPTPSSDKRYENWEPYNAMDEPYLKFDAKPKMQYGYRNSWRPSGSKTT